MINLIIILITIIVFISLFSNKKIDIENFHPFNYSYEFHNYNSYPDNFDFENRYVWWRDPYSIDLWLDTIERHRKWNVFHRRRFLNIDNHIYI